MSKRGLRITPEGWGFLAVTLGIGLAALNTGNNLVYLVLGMMLSLILLSGLLSDFVLLRVRARRTLPRRAVAGRACLVELAIENDKAWLPSFALVARDLTSEEVARRKRDAKRRARSTFTVKLDPRGRERAGYVEIPRRRGRLAFTHVELSTSYPFGLFDKWRTFTDEGALIVHPADVPVPDLERRLEALVGAEDEALDARVRARGLGAEATDLRPFREGDEARLIHWRRSARLGALVVRERERPPSSRLAIRVLFGADDDDAAARVERIERVVARAASIARIAHARGVSIEVLTPGERFGPIPAEAPLEPLLDFFALLEPRLGEPLPPPSLGARVLEVGDARDGAEGTP